MHSSETNCKFYCMRGSQAEIWPATGPTCTSFDENLWLPVNHCSRIWDGFLGVMLRGIRAWVVFASVIYLCKNWKSPFKLSGAKPLQDNQLTPFSRRDLSVGPSKDHNISTPISPKRRVSCLLPDQNLPASSDWRLFFTFSFPYPTSIDKWKI